MDIKHTANVFIRFLLGRIARNIYFWSWVLYTAFELNKNNERIYHYGTINSSWYLPLMVILFLLQCILVYTNNLFLIPKYLLRKKRILYVINVFLLVSIVSLATSLLLKAATPFINTAHFQQPGFVATIFSPKWDMQTIFLEVQTFWGSNLLWLFVFTMAWYMTDYARQQQALQEAERMRTEAELAYLKNQINPHFLFNTLNNIYGLSLQKSDHAPEVILKLSSLLRYLLYESSVPSISFLKEKAAIESYVEIEALRLPDDANVNLTLQADHDYKIPSLLWMPLLENVFKHGTRLIGIPIYVDFILRIENNVMQISTKNSYAPSSEDMPKEFGGIGLTNLRKRLDILFPGAYFLQIEGNNGIYSTNLKVQLK